MVEIMECVQVRWDEEGRGKGNRKRGYGRRRARWNTRCVDKKRIAMVPLTALREGIRYADEEEEEEDKRCET